MVFRESPFWQFFCQLEKSRHDITQPSENDVRVATERNSFQDRVL